MSCAVTRMRFPARRTLPSRIVPTPIVSAILRISCSLPLKANAEVRAMTFSPGILASKFRISSASPSLKYSFSLSALMLAKGRTAMEGVLPVAVAVACSRAARTSFMVWNRLAGNLRKQRVTIAERLDGASSGAQDRTHFREGPGLCGGIESRRNAGSSHLRQSEIQQLHAGGGHQNVARFQIAMRDAFLMRGVERITNLHGVAERSIERKRTIERSPLDKLHDQIIWADVVNLADVGMIQRGDGFGFTLGALRELQRGNFNGHIAIQTRVFGAIHLTHAARANRREDLVGAESIACRKWHRSESAKSTRSRTG